MTVNVSVPSPTFAGLSVVVSRTSYLGNSSYNYLLLK